MKLSFKKYHPHLFIKSLGEQLEKSTHTDCLEERIELDGHKGSGVISGFLFGEGLSFLVFDCMLNEDWELYFETKSPPPILFNFDIEGEISHTFNNGDIRYHLNPLQGSITACPKDSAQKIRLPGKRRILFTILMIDRESYLKKIDCILDKMPDKLADVFSDKASKKPFFYQGNYSISAAECINKITNDRHKGLVRSTYLEAKVLELLSRQVRQFQDDLLYPEKQVMIRKYDIEKIKYARDLLIEDLKNTPIIATLAKKAGINQQKLKKGFKIIFDSTINQYLTDERLDRASLLLLKGYSVADTAAEIGYANQSHFSKKFKEKFGVLPKKYSSRIHIPVK